MADLILTESFGVARAQNHSAQEPNAWGVLGITVLVNGSPGPVILRVIHVKSNAIVFAAQSNNGVENTSQLSGTVANPETYTIVATDPSGTYPAAVATGIQPPATVNLNLSLTNAVGNYFGFG